MSASLSDPLNRKIVVVHAGSRDRYQVALALHEVGRLEKLVTDLYFPLDDPAFVRRWGRFLPLEMMRKRWCPGLPGHKVVSSRKALGVIAANRGLGGRANLHPVSDALLGKRAAAEAERSGAHLLAYCTYASSAFSALPHAPGRKKILFTQQAHPLWTADQAVRCATQFPDETEAVFRNLAFYLPPDQVWNLVMEGALADAIISPSESCLRSWLAHRTEQHIPSAVAAYGGPSLSMPPKKAQEDSVVRLAFVGKLLPLKGASILLRAWAAVPDSHRGELHLFVSSTGELEMYRAAGLVGGNVSVHVGISGQALYEQLAACDAFVFPSLSEGSALVLLEALTCGLPVIATPNAGGDRIIVEGEHGFTVPAHDQEALTARLAWCLENRETLHRMGRRGRERAELFTWERFRAGLQNAVAELVPG